MSQRTVAIVSLVLVMAIWGSAFSVTKAAITDVPPITFALLRFFFALAVLLPLAFARHKRTAQSLRGAWRILAVMGVCGITLFYVGSNLALAYTTATQGVIVQSTIPVVTALIAVFALHERPSGKRIVGIILSLVGVVLAVLIAAPSQDASNPLLGSALMLGAVVAWALYTILAKRVATADQLVVTAYSSAIGTLFLVPLALLEVRGAALPALSLQAWLSLVYLGVVSSAGGHLLYNRSLIYLDASQTATFINLAPIVGVASAVVFLGEAIVGWQLLGGALVLLGVWLTT
jgi:drug/metabolite transporter (DMT)-like permease